MNIKDFDTDFTRVLLQKYNFNLELPDHIKFYKNKLKSVNIESDNNFNIFWNEERRVIDTVFKKYKNLRILEIGSGIGQLSIFLKLNGINIEACEINNDRILDFYYFCRVFKTHINIHNQKFQSLNLDNYDVFLAVDISNTENNFKTDFKLLEKINSKNKFIFIEPFSYDDLPVTDDKKDYYKYCMEMQYKFFNSI